MAKSTRVNTKIRKPRPKTTGTLVGVRLQPALLASLDKFVANEAKQMTRPEAVRLLLTDSLIELALLDTAVEENGDGPGVRLRKGKR